MTGPIDAARDLVRKTTVRTPRAPTFAELIQGSGEVPLTDAQRAGLGIDAALSLQRTEDAQATKTAREAREAEQRKADDALYAHIQKRGARVARFTR